MDEKVKQRIPTYNIGTIAEGSSDAFGMFKLEPGHDRYENTNYPHRHDHYTLIVLCEGFSKQIIDFKTYEAKDAALLFIQPGQVHYEANHGHALMYVITFTKEFLLAYSADNHWVQQFNTNLLLLKPSERNALLSYLELLQTEFTTFKLSKAVIAQLLLAMLEKTAIYVSYQTEVVARKRYSALMNQFLDLVELNFLREVKVTDYAAKLFISAGHLNDVVKETMGTNAKAVIDERRILEAKRLLFWTQLPVKEIGWKIGFEDPAYFTRFFKKHTGILPATFQRNLQQKTPH